MTEGLTCRSVVARFHSFRPSRNAATHPALPNSETRPPVFRAHGARCAPSVATEPRAMQSVTRSHPHIDLRSRSGTRLAVVVRVDTSALQTATPSSLAVQRDERPQSVIPSLSRDLQLAAGNAARGPSRSCPGARSPPLEVPRQARDDRLGALAVPRWCGVARSRTAWEHPTAFRTVTLSYLTAIRFGWAKSGQLTGAGGRCTPVRSRCNAIRRYAVIWSS
jgi:hypothetical protein